MFSPEAWVVCEPDNVLKVSELKLFFRCRWDIPKIRNPREGACFVSYIGKTLKALSTIAVPVLYGG